LSLPGAVGPAVDQEERKAMSQEKGHGSTAAKRANAKASKEGKSNPRKSSAAQSELGRKGAKARKSG